MGGMRIRRFRMGREEFAVVSFPIEIPAGITLTKAEREVATFVARGMTNKQIAEARRTSENTVANQLKAIFKKLGVQSRVELVKMLA